MPYGQRVDEGIDPYNASRVWALPTVRLDNKFFIRIQKKVVPDKISDNIKLIALSVRVV